MNLIQQITELYDKEVLGKELSEDSSLRKQLKEGLERILDKIDFPDNAVMNTLYETAIDYLAIEALSRSSIATRIQTALRGRKIYTYGDLVKMMKKQTRQDPNGEQNYRSYIRSIGNIGNMSTEIIMQHLNNIKFDYHEKARRLPA